MKLLNFAAVALAGVLCSAMPASAKDKDKEKHKDEKHSFLPRPSFLSPRNLAAHSPARLVTRDWDRDRDDHDRHRGDRSHDRDWWNRYHRHDRVVIIGGSYLYNPYYYDYEPRYVYAEPAYDSDSTAADVQRRLRREGYYYGPIDGDIGPMTRGALAAFQRDNGLRPTGRINTATLESLGLY